jgi:hypothetical protein
MLGSTPWGPSIDGGRFRGVLDRRTGDSMLH